MPDDRGRGGGGQARPAWASSSTAVVLAVLAGAAVALGASQAGLLTPRPESAAAPPTWIRGLAIGVAALGAALLWVTRSRYPATRTQRQGPAGRAVRTVALIMAALAWLTLFAPRPPASDEASESEPQSAGTQVNPDLPSVPGSPGDSPEPPRLSGATPNEATDFQPPAPPEVEQQQQTPSPMEPSVGPPLTSWLWLLVALGLITTVALLRRRATTEAPMTTLTVETEEAEAGLLGSLAEITRDSGDVRTQITLAYRHLLAALAEIGVGREPYQAPHEYLYRVLGPLGVRAEPLHELTQLYVLAQFSEHPLTPAHRAAAVDALESSLEQLQATQPTVPELAAGVR